MKALSVIIAIAALSGCSGQPAKSLGMANPASLYCQQLNGRLELVKTESGTNGYCTLPSGERLEEWALYRRDRPTQ